MLLAFAVCVIPVHVWLVINFLDQARGIMIRVSTWDFVGVVSYILAFALLESFLLFLVMLLLAFVLPARIFRSKFVALSTVVVILATGWFIYLQYNRQLISDRQVKLLAVWAISLLLTMGVLFLLVHRSRRLETTIHALAQRLAILAVLYVFVDLVAVAIVVVRNL